MKADIGSALMSLFARALTRICLTLMLVAGFNFPAPSEDALFPFVSLLLLELLLSFPLALALAFGAIVCDWG